MTGRARSLRARACATGVLTFGALALGIVSDTGVAAAAGNSGSSGSTGTGTGTGTPTKLLTNAPPCNPGPVPATTTTTTTTTTTSSTTTTTSTTTTSTTTTTLAGGSTSTTTTAPSATTTSSAPTTTTLPSTGTTTTIPTSTPGARSAYDLVTAKGLVSSYGGAAFFGDKVAHRLPSAVVAAAATVDGGGYWLATTKGNLYNLGDATFLGSPVHQRLGRKRVVAFAPSPDSGGYWFVLSNGSVQNYGDAAYCGSPVHQHLPAKIVAMAPTPDGEGYWLVDARGDVFTYGDAPNWGEDPGLARKARIVGIAATPDGGGYWLAASNGSVFNFGDAAFLGSAAGHRLRRPIASFAATPDGAGYWIAEANGSIFNFGDAAFLGSLAAHQPKAPDGVVAFVRTYVFLTTSTLKVPHHLIGYDISNYQCAKQGAASASSSLPTVSQLSIIEVAGWLDNADNSCLASEVAWAKRAATPNDAPYELYLFMNSPDTSASAQAVYASGPRGTCSTLSGTPQLVCIAYNYGFNGAKSALAYAKSQGASAAVWWLDVERASLSSNDYSNIAAGDFWSGAPDLNAQTIQGAIDALHQAGVLVGIYSTSVQYPVITGGYVPTGQKLPLWIAGVPWTNPPFTEKGLDATSVLSAWCAGTAGYTGYKGNDIFAGGTPFLLQETPGSEPSPYGLDPDWSC